MTRAGGGGPTEMLEGKALLERARALSNQPEDQIARACGYVGPSGRVLRKSFYRALVAAKGYPLPGGLGATESSGNHGKGRQAEFRTRVHGNGNLLIGNAYTRRLGLHPGQEFRIEIHQETGSIWLLPLEDGEAAGSAEASGTEPIAAEPDDTEPSAEHREQG
jgi:bifunctional DNA-binding transcriptional regulator/antitoxin component of YhaV-PrlF toxin-antitoxin module